MRSPCTLSPRAQGDLDEIWEYAIRRWGVDRAELYTRRIGQDIAAVAAQPAMGRACPDIRAGYYKSGYYKYRTGSHVFFYRPIPGGIDAVRILHERMDFVRHF